MFSNTPAASAQFVRRYADKQGLPLSPEFQRAAENYDYYNQQFLPHQYDTIAKGTAGPGGAKFGEYGYNSVAASKKIANTPGAGLWAIGIDPNSSDADRQAQAFIDNNTNRGYEGLRMTSGNWGRADAELPNLLKMKQANPDLTAKQLLDYQLRGGHMQSALPPRSFDVADVLVPLGEVALGFLGGPTWGPVLGAGLGGGYGLANNGLMGGILGAAGGYGGAGFGADVAAKGVGGALANQVSGITGLLKPGGLSSGVSSAFTPTNIGSTAVNALGSVPQSWATPSTSAANNILPLAAFGTQAAGALKPTPAKPVTPITPAPVKPVISTPVKPVTPPTTNPFNINPATIRQRFGPMNTVNKASGGMLPTTKTEMNPMGGAPAAAYGLASFGRGPDSMLVHMSQPEVNALQQLARAHGGSLTTNPTTGLPEAGFLSSILPAIIGIGATLAAPFTAGTSLAGLGAFMGSPLAMGLTAGGLAGVASGFNPREMLKWGLGVGGGVGLGQGFAGVGANAATGGVGAELTPQAMAQSLPSWASSAARTAATAPSGIGAEIGSAAAQNASNLGSGVMQALKGNWEGFNPGMGGLIGTGGRGLAGAIGASVLAPMALTPPDPLKIQQQKSPYPPYGGPYIWTGGPNGQLQQMDTGQVIYDIPSQGGLRSPSFPYGYAQGGVAALAQDDVMKKGGYLDGPGDGMSDSIRATIEDRQPARLADGEFVVPADVVSHLGNGSSKAGAKRLYAMMDRVRTARTGHPKQGKEIKADRYLPA